MGYFAVTTVTSGTPTASSGSVSFTVADASKLPSPPFSAWHYPQLRNDVSGVTRAKQAQKIDVTAVSGATVTATLGRDTTGRAVGFGDVIDVIGFAMPGSVRIGTGDHSSRFSPLSGGGVGQRLDIVHGSQASPIITRDAGSTVQIARWEALPGSQTGGANAALEVVSIAESGHAAGVGSNAIIGYALGYWRGNTGDNDLIGGSFTGEAAAGSKLKAWGLSVSGVTSSDDSPSTALEVAVYNGTSGAVAYNGILQGISLVSTNAVGQAGRGASVTNGVAIIVGNAAADGTWSGGLWGNAASLKDFFIRDDSDATVSIDLYGSHSGAVLQITNELGQYMQKWTRASAVSGSYGIAVEATAGAWILDEVAVATKLKIAKGTPGANTTCLYIQNGAGPSLSQVKTYNDGVHTFLII